MSALPARLTWRDVVNQEMGESVGPTFADHILWEHTAFPAGGVETIRRQIRELRDRKALEGK